MRATMSILGLLNYDNDLFEDMVVPETIDKEKLVDNIVEECAELELLYPSALTMKAILPRWSSRRLPVWNRISEALTAEYNLLHNYDRTETWTDSREGSRTSSGTRNVNRDGDNVHAETTTGTEQRTTTTSGTDDSTVTRSGTEERTTTTIGTDDITLTKSGTESKSITTHSETDTTGSVDTDETVTNSVVGYDSAAFVNHDKSVKDGTVATTSGTTTDGTETDSGTSSGTETTDRDTTGREAITGETSATETTESETTGTETVNGSTGGTRRLTDTIDETDAETTAGSESSEDESTHNGHISGNIGVTTSQQMVEAEITLRMVYDLYNIITQEFKEKFCIMVY